MANQRGLCAAQAGDWVPTCIITMHYSFCLLEAVILFIILILWKLPNTAVIYVCYPGRHVEPLVWGAGYTPSLTKEQINS